MKHRQLTGLGAFGIAVLLVLGTMVAAGCSSNKSRVGSMLNVDTDVHLTFFADQNINPDNQANPAPVFIRLYELRSDELFQRADFLDLYEDDASVLGKDFVNKRQLSRLAPGESREEQLVLDKKTRYIGLLAEFYEYEGSAYHLVVPVTAHNMTRNRVRVQVSGNRISLVK